MGEATEGREAGNPVLAEVPSSSGPHLLHLPYDTTGTEATPFSSPHCTSFLPPFEYPLAPANDPFSALLLSILDLSAVLRPEAHLPSPFAHGLDLLIWGGREVFKDRSTDFDGWLNLRPLRQATEHGMIIPFPMPFS